MERNPITSEATAESPVAAARLLRGFGARGWIIAHHETLSYWSAEHVSADRHSIRYLTAFSAGQLAGMIETVEQAGS